MVSTRDFYNASDRRAGECDSLLTSLVGRHWGMCVSLFYDRVGALAILAASGIVTIQLLIHQRKGVREFWALGLSAVIAAIMIAFTTFVPGHQALKAHEVTQFLSALVLVASWPLRPGLIILQLPMVALAYHCIVHRIPRNSLCWTVLGIAGFVALQMVSLAYGRAAGPIAPRYLDLLSVSLLLNFVALLFLMRQTLGVTVRNALIGFVIAWTIAIGIGLAQATDGAMRGAAERGQLSQLQAQNVNAYLGGNRFALRDKPPLQIPYPTAERLEHLLDDPLVLAILPRELRSDQSAGSEIRSHLFLRGRLFGFALGFEQAMLRAKYLFLALGIATFFIALLLSEQLNLSVVSAKNRADEKSYSTTRKSTRKYPIESAGESSLLSLLQAHSLLTLCKHNC